MKNYKIIDDRFKESEFDNFGKAAAYCIKHKGMMYVNRNGDWVKHSNYSELVLNGIHFYSYTERKEAKIYKCKKCGVFNIDVNIGLEYCKMCNGNLILLEEK